MGHFVFFSLSSFFLFFLAVLVAHQSPVITAQNALQQATARFGVILNLASMAGKRSRTGIQMAVDDFYAAYPNSASRVALDFRDSTGDVIGAASAAVDLIKNAQVQAIIGPQTSTEAEFVAYLGNRTHVPILSFAATSPALSPSHTLYFVRAAANDSFQAAPIAAFVDAFGWRAAVLVYEDSPYGNGIVPALVDALQGVGTRIPDRTTVPTDASDDRLDAELYRLVAMPTRVFVVHMLPPLAARLFRRAQLAGMMSEGYIWIATDGVGSVLDMLGRDDIDAMQGLVTLSPYVHVTSRVTNFSARFKARFRQENPNVTDVADPNVVLFWAYDAAWAAAAAAEAAGAAGPAFQTPQRGNSFTDLDRLGVSVTGPRLLSAVLSTAFDGLAGKFQLVNGQLQLSAYEIINVIGKGARTVGFWTPEAGLSRGLGAATTASKTDSVLKQILWPGEPDHVPKGWDAAPNGRRLRIGVPVKHGFTQFVAVSTDPRTNQTNITGYCIDVFDAVMAKLPYAVHYDYIPFPDSSESYTELVLQVYEKKFDAVVGDTTIIANRTSYVDFTMPYTESGVSMIVGVQKDTSKSMWIFLQPLTAGLWLVSLAFFVFTGFVVWVIEHRINPEFRGTPWQQFGITFYFAFSTLVFSHKEKLESNLSRFVVTIWVFVVLILTSSYTASLTSMLTVQQLQPTLTDVKELLRRGDYVGYQDGSFVVDLLKRMNFDTSKMRHYSTADQYAEALSKGSANGGVAAIFDEIPYLKLFLSQYCDDYAVAGPTYKTDGFGFVFPRGSPMVPDVSRAILQLTEGDDMARIERKWFGDPSACLSQSSSLGSSSLSFSSFGGLFIITSIVSGLALLIYLAIFIFKEWDELRAVGSGSEKTSLQRLRAWMQHYDSKDLKSPTFKKSYDGSVRNSSDADLMDKAREEEARRDFAAAMQSPISISNSSEMNTASSQEEMPTMPSDNNDAASFEIAEVREVT